MKQVSNSVQHLALGKILSALLVFSILFSLFVPTASALTPSESTTVAERNQIAKNWAYLEQGYKEYNCLAWAVGITTAWIWPWGSDNPTLNEVDTYLENRGYISASNAMSCNIYAYGTTDSICHFARGRGAGPLAVPIDSKWGKCELFSHTTYSPYYTIAEGGLYGNLQAYYYLP